MNHLKSSNTGDPFWKFKKTYPKPVKRSCMDEDQDGGSKPPISTKNII